MERPVRTLLAHPRLLVLAMALVAIRLALMIQFPVIADEAYYFYWGTHPAGGYYDLPPMVGWWETFLTSFSLTSLWLRLPNLATMVLVALGIREWTRPELGETGATWLGMIFFFLPLPFLAVMVAPDLPLLFFTFYAAVLFYNARRRRDYLLAGALWGAAFLSKYFAVFTLPALLVWFVLSRRGADRPAPWTSLLWFVLGALPFGLQHLIWNATHCWANLVFNLVTRQKVSDGAWSDVMLLFLLYLVLMSTPFLWKNIFRRGGKGETTGPDSRRLEGYFLFLWSVPMALFAITALLGRGQGLHWYIPYLPFFVLWMGLRIRDRDSLHRRAAGVMMVSFLLGLAAIGALESPDQLIKPALRGRHTFEYELAFRTDDIFDRIYPSLNGMEAVALDGYSLASVFDLEFKRRLGRTSPTLLVMGTGSRFGRVFDFTSPWKELNGKNVLMIARSEWSPYDWSRFFESTESKWVEENGVRFWLSKGIGFRYELYRDEVIRRSADEYYPRFMGLPDRCELRASNE
jgi:hypothetical protein